MSTVDNALRLDQFKPLLTPLPTPEAYVLMHILVVYYADGMEQQLSEAIYQIGELQTTTAEGYSGLTDDDRAGKEMKAWRKSLQTVIESLAHPSIGRDRQAIALAHYRDFIMKVDPEAREQELELCRRQLVDLYNFIAPLPFEL